MNAIKNRVQLIGNLGDNPEVTEYAKGKKVARFNIATNEDYKGSDGKVVKETQWHPVVMWGKLAEITEQYVKKGQMLALEGKLVHRSYEKDGQKRYITEVVASEMLMLGKNGADKASK